jgi:para-nitrobenzyl esterase
MMKAFVDFAGSGKANWPQYRLPERATMMFDVLPRVENDPRREQREIFARVPYVQPGT